MSSTEYYDPARDLWLQAPPMLTERGWHASAVLSGCIYALGGQVPTSKSASVSSASTASMERLDPREGKWQPLRDMFFKRHQHCAVELDGMLYALGGLMTERYDPRNDTWELLENMQGGPRWSLGAAAVHGSIYTVGGVDHLQREMLGVERYQPATGLWTLLGQLSQGRRSLACVASPAGDESLLMICGSRGDQALSSVERVSFLNCD